MGGWFFLSWVKQVNEVSKKAWYAWHKIKKLCSKYKGLKMASIIHLVKIAVLPILFYCSPVWLLKHTNSFHDIFYDIVKTATGSTCKPSKSKLEVICALPPIEIQVKSIIIKFLIKNYIQHDPDILSNEIDEKLGQTQHFIQIHGNLLKDYIKEHEKKTRSLHSMHLQEYRFGNIKYTKNSMWKYVQLKWSKILESNEITQSYKELIQERAIRTPCNRAVEVYLLDCIHGHIALNNFLWKLGLNISPLCDCQLEAEMPDHLIFHCAEFAERRQRLDIVGTSIIEYLKVHIKTQNYGLKKLCQLVKTIRSNRYHKGRKTLKYYLDQRGSNSL